MKQTKRWNRLPFYWLFGFSFTVALFLLFNRYFGWAFSLRSICMQGVVMASGLTWLTIKASQPKK